MNTDTLPAIVQALAIVDRLIATTAVGVSLTLHQRNGLSTLRECLAALPAPVVDATALLALAAEWKARCDTPECNWIHQKANLICADELISLVNGRPFGAALAKPVAYENDNG